MYCENISDDGLAALPNLKRLSIDTVIGDHMIRGSLSCPGITDSGLGMLTNLSYLAITHNTHLKGRNLSSLQNLRTLVLGYNSTIGDSIISGLTNLKTLVVKNRRLIIDRALIGLVGLTSLDIRRCKITSTGLVHLTNLTTLHTSTLSSSIVKSLPNLKVLSLVWNPQEICNRGDPDILQGLTNLRVLSVEQCNVNIETLIGLPKMTALNVYKTNIHLSHLNQMTNLKILCRKYKYNMPPVPPALSLSCDMIVNWNQYLYNLTVDD